MNSSESPKTTTIADIASAVGVTKSTISRALAGKGNFSPEMRQTIRETARRMNYEPNPYAQRLSKGGAPNTVAMFSLMMDRGVATHKLQVLQQLLANKGFEVPSYAYGYCMVNEVTNQNSLLAMVRRQRPRAIVCNSQSLLPEALDELSCYISEGGVVVAYDVPLDLDCDQVIFDREDNTYQSTRHLIEQGHRNLGIYMPLPLKDPEERLDGFCRALCEAGIAYDESMLFGLKCGDEIGDGMYEDAGAQIAARFLQMKDRPTAMVIINDYAAVAFAAALERAGVRVPEDVSVVGNDDSPIARYGTLPLTSVSQPASTIAHAVFDMLMDRLEGDYTGPSRRTVICGELMVRDSVVPPKKESKTTKPQSRRKGVVRKSVAALS